MGWFTRRHKLWRNQLALPPLTTRSCSELSSRRSSDDKLCGSETDCDTLFFIPSIKPVPRDSSKNATKNNSKQYPTKKLYRISSLLADAVFAQKLTAIQR